MSFEKLQYVRRYCGLLGLPHTMIVVGSIKNVEKFFASLSSDNWHIVGGNIGILEYTTYKEANSLID